MIGRKPRTVEKLDLTPMVDVTFLLLIFFMITASFVREKSLPTPSGADSDIGWHLGPVPEEVSILVEIDSSNRVYVEGQFVEDFEATTAAISLEMAREANTDLLLVTHPDSLHGNTIRVLDAAMDSRIQKIRYRVLDSI